MTDRPWSICKNANLPVRHIIPDINLQVEAVRAGMGMMFGPCIMYRDDPDIVRVPGEEIHHYLDLWVLSHRDLRLSARMRILREILAEELAAMKPRFDSCHPEGEPVAKMQRG